MPFVEMSHLDSDIHVGVGHFKVELLIERDLPAHSQQVSVVNKP
jgi:hypothetical protein